MLLALLVASAPAHAAPCPDLTDLSAEIRTAIDSVELETAQALAAQVTPAIDCQEEAVSPLALHALLVTAGAAHHFQGQDARSTELFTWAAAAAPTSLPDAALGAGVNDLYQSARSDALVAIPASVVVGLGPLWIDGSPGEPNTAIAVPPGVHLVQWTAPSGELVSRRLELYSGEQLQLAGGRLPPPVARSSSLPPAPTGPRPATRWMRVGGAAGILAGAGFLTASAMAHQQFDQSTERAELVSLQQTVNGRTLLGASSVALGGAIFLSSWSPRLQSGSRP